MRSPYRRLAALNLSTTCGSSSKVRYGACWLRQYIADVASLPMPVNTGPSKPFAL